MKRYRLTKFFLDTSRNIFNQPAGEHIDKAKEGLRSWLVAKYGTANFDEKFVRYMALQKPVFSVVSEHIQLLEDICGAYVQGNMYSALTGACCLGERIFNDIIFRIKDDFKTSEHYKKIYNKGSIIDWPLAIQILFDWKVIDSETKEKYKELYNLRTESVHYQQKQQDLEKLSLNAINVVNFIVERIFGVGPHRKDILLYFDVPGEVYIRKSAERNPIVKEYYIPSSSLVGPNFRMENAGKIGSFRIIDQKYEDKEITDQEFINLRKGIKK